MSIVGFSESNIVKAIMYKNEIREDSEYFMPVWIHLIIVHNNIKLYRRQQYLYYDNDGMLIQSTLRL